MPINNATRGLVIGLKVTGKSNGEISQLTGLPRSTVQDIYSRALKQGFDPEKRPLEICDAHIAVSTRAGSKKPKADVPTQTPTEQKLESSDA